jgi:hypothetical protein
MAEPLDSEELDFQISKMNLNAEKGLLTEEEQRSERFEAEDLKIELECIRNYSADEAIIHLAKSDNKNAKVRTACLQIIKDHYPNAEIYDGNIANIIQLLLKAKTLRERFVFVFNF